MTTLARDAGVIAQQYYVELEPELDYVAKAFSDPSLAARVEANARWGITQPNPEPNLVGAGERHILDTDRSTLIHNVEAEGKGARWARIARPDTKCAFCRMLAARGPVYHSEHAAAASHDRCKCTVICSRPGQRLSTPRYIRAWNNEYENAKNAVVATGQAKTFDNIVQQWNKDIRAMDAAAQAQAPANVA